MEQRFRNKQSFKRRPPVRQPFDRVLIVCEGSKTEPLYFRALVEDLRLSAANVEVTGDGGSAPQSVVEYAIRRFEADPSYDQVWCVFDRDAHPRFHEALDQVKHRKLTRRANRRKIGTCCFEAVPSTPCFEYWLLLHFCFTTTPLPRYADVEPLLRQQPGFVDYGKGQTNTYAVTSNRLDTALRNADRANAAAEDSGTDNPTTHVPRLVWVLRALAQIRVGCPVDLNSIGALPLSRVGLGKLDGRHDSPILVGHPYGEFEVRFSRWIASDRIEGVLCGTRSGPSGVAPPMLSEGQHVTFKLKD